MILVGKRKLNPPDEDSSIEDDADDELELVLMVSSGLGVHSKPYEFISSINEAFVKDFRQSSFENFSRSISSSFFR
jgi:hypothetical protein